MNRKTRFGLNVGGYMLMFILVPKAIRWNLEALAVIIAVASIIGIIYEIYVYYGEKEETGMASTAAILGALALIGIIALASPAVQEDFEDGRIILPTYEAFAVITVENSHVLLGKDYELYRDGKLIQRFHLKAWEKKIVTEKITWIGLESKNTTYKLVSSGAGGIGDRTTTKTVTLKSKETASFSISA